MAFTPDLSVAIILVNWNGFDFTAACLQSLRKVEFPDFQVIVVDNASENSEGKRLLSTFPEILLIENPVNLGFAGGNNSGIRRALEDGYTHIMLLNNDTEVEPDFLGEMMLVFKIQKNLGIVQPLITFLNDKTKIWSAGGTWNSFLGRAITRGDRNEISAFQAKDVSLDWATGCCLLIKREALLAAGLLNEGYFAYFEDVEWSLRFRKMGYGIGLASKAMVYHEAGASSKKEHAEGILSPRVFYFHVRNQFYLIRQNLEGLAFAASVTYHIFRFLAWMGYFCFRGRFKKLQAVVRGIKDGLGNKLEKAPTWP
ncbi:glycosyltransferase family 2 protein [Algoriphagus pacificus]|uniref:Glycosyltransferase family 2 protein n=1 Tax=Algoriphagus pacificus TaxID=2811234 RepID=A0ABS3CG72_9BACT|nr:glycosyltransferase family 2 protein [Algoriphagus pacificus]MBN7814644.1 glycosyltransferase family 2 protein [Algoriphagus pacificus]